MTASSAGPPTDDLVCERRAVDLAYTILELSSSRSAFPDERVDTRPLLLLLLLLLLGCWCAAADLRSGWAARFEMCAGEWWSSTGRV